MTIVLSDEYAATLRDAAGNYEVRNYCLGRLSQTLREMGISEACALRIMKLIIDFSSTTELSAKRLAEEVESFQKEWRTHLNRTYLSDYEAVRSRFIAAYVLPALPNTREPRRYLDIGCGRGCLTVQVGRHLKLRDVTGIDGSDFSPEWNERRSLEATAKFFHVSLSQQNTWMENNGPFDIVTLFYVLHHSTPHWTMKTLHGIRSGLERGGKVIVVEDALSTSERAHGAQLDLEGQWRAWARLSRVYSLTPAFSAQVLLDFVAVQLLAGFSDVSMPCNYRTTDDWKGIFESVGFVVERSVNIGFPPERDIDVPQAMFVLRLAEGQLET